MANKTVEVTYLDDGEDLSLSRMVANLEGSHLKGDEKFEKACRHAIEKLKNPSKKIKVVRK